MGRILDAGYALTLLPHYLYHRLGTGKYGPAAPEKLGRFPPGSPPGEATLWVHGVSVGEVLAARPLVRAFEERYPGRSFSVSTTTETGRAVAQKRFGPGRVFYFPLDFSWIVRRAFDRVRPSLVLLMELELWPHFLEEAARRAAPVVVANVRISARSARRFRRLGPLARRMLDRVALWTSQDETNAARLRSLGVEEERIRVVGSLKYDGLEFSEDPEETARLHAALGGGRILLAGSTHPGEEEILLAAFEKLRGRLGFALRLVLVPRHPERTDAIERLVPPGLKAHRRSRGPAPSGADLVLVDTIGELAGMYGAAEAVVVGGSLVPGVGGHNMLEPAALARPIVYGPSVFNFEEPAGRLERAQGAIRLPDSGPGTLASALEGLLRSPEAARAMGGRAREAARAMQGAAARTLDALGPFLAQARA
ncbi:MAG: 3-deoxy-D-manno-octulosonic acid transferase [Planctomycetota bacterium]